MSRRGVVGAICGAVYAAAVYACLAAAVASDSPSGVANADLPPPPVSATPRGPDVAAHVALERSGRAATVHGINSVVRARSSPQPAAIAVLGLAFAGLGLLGFRRRT